MRERKGLHTEALAALRVRMQERRLLFAATLVVALGLFLTYQAKTTDFKTVGASMAEGEIVDLNNLLGSEALQAPLAVLYSDPADQQLTATHIAESMASRRAAQRLPWSLPNVGQLNTAAFSVTARQAEQGGASFQERLAKARRRLGMTPDGNVIPVSDSASVGRFVSEGVYRLEGRVVDPEGTPMPGVAVTLQGTRTSMTRTDGNGRYRFEGLASRDSLVVRPVVRYFAFTPEVVPSLRGDQRHHFEAQVHRLPLFSSLNQLQRIKNKLVVRSPERYDRLFLGLVFGYFVVFYLLHFFWFRRRFAGDPVLLPVMHLLTGLALMLMFSLPDPLRDLMRAQGYVAGIAMGGALMGIASQLDFQRDLWRKQTFAWLGLGVLLAAVLYLFGSGPTGSDAKVNLTLPLLGTVQPVEMIKLCLVLFLAGYFARHWAFIRELNQHQGMPRLLRWVDIPRWRDLAPVGLGLAIALLTFFALRDMGPALVVACTFLVLYGIVRNRWFAVSFGFMALVAVFWYAYQSDSVPMVADRIEMLLTPWENFVRGGEHLAHAYWALATGGMSGQGIGQGHPGYIPAAHTDMVLPALGEELGLLGLLAVFALYAVLIYRILRISLRAGGEYSLFLGLSIALIILFQVLLIAGGAFGLIPLSGVVTPFLSFGKSSMIANGLLMGMLMSISSRPGRAVQHAAQRHHFHQPLRAVVAVACVLLGVIVMRVVYIQAMRADAWAVKPALVLRGSGERAYIYNPRILEARRELVRGSVYDRNGIPLATSRFDEMEHLRPVYEALGIDVDVTDRTDPRYYPFDALTFYLLGDVRTRVKWGADNSLYAEHAYLSHLRGYENHPEPIIKQVNEKGAARPVTRYDYSELTSLVRYGRTSGQARALLRRNRDLYLTIDIALQQRVAQVMAERVAEGKIASAIVLDVATGDVLASVTYPLPDTAFSDPSVAHRDPGLFDRGFGGGAKPPGSTFKLVTAMAALNKDPQAAAWTHAVRSYDRYARRQEPTGKVNMARSITASSNVYFAALAHDVVGVDTLLQTLNLFNFGVGSGPLSQREQRALMREPDNLRQSGFGQGPITASPLQVALVSATIANRGVVPEVAWVRRSEAERSDPVVATSPHHAQMLGAYMRRVVTHREGTAKSLRKVSVPMAGKTGTAEEKVTVMEEGEKKRVTYNHAWFTGFAPYYEPGETRGRQIAIAVLVEEGGGGGRIAAPIAGAIAEEALDLGLITLSANLTNR